MPIVAPENIARLPDHRPVRSVTFQWPSGKMTGQKQNFIYALTPTFECQVHPVKGLSCGRCRTAYLDGSTPACASLRSSSPVVVGSPKRSHTRLTTFSTSPGARGSRPVIRLYSFANTMLVLMMPITA